MKKKKILTLVSILLLISVSCIAGLNAVRAAANNVAINYSIGTSTGSSNGVPENYVFVNMTIKNNGYSSFAPISYEFSMNESGDNYPSTALTAAAYLGSLPSSQLNNGQSCSGSLVYYVDNPNVNGAQFTLSYSNGMTVTQNIIWNGQASASNSSPTQVVAPSITLTSSPTVVPTSTTNSPTPTTTSSPATPEFPTIAILAAFLGLSLIALTLLTVRKRKISNS